ncbi:hypothetical protein A2304_03565 [Candidatus Uhrbacteria bacterium RIFOXYB2_FULL_57_15]|uniref:O-antigen ligase-related domain-containing protein n=1 Tax=Candidatus Uhrbacteria bacterium RIFOXYB2_FULL_57_15 TaxID=1802422 RepID=A0A1F7W5V1_9BACT|nr:MAG: hypothetical protein A2304_03565 [Candidatus Uhrbacteria bacterium RIFOXYB2_FULL_57_15]OGM00114.1 MAG: hypothetical protein A2501_01220 [Candidatus Uhrbacteria bacterium RIFOXYC12_FULL_57_11]
MIFYPFVLIALSALFAFVSWRDIRYGLILLAAILPAYLLRFDLGPVPMTLLEAFAFILVAIWLMRTMPLGPKPRDPVPRAWILPIALLLVAASVAVLVAPDHLSALGIWKAYFVEPILVFIVATDTLRRHPEDHRRLLAALGTGGLFVAICAVVQWLTGLGIPAPWDVEGRVVSIFPYPNAVGLYLAPVIVIAASSLRRTAHRSQNAFWILTLVLSSIAIMLSQSEAAIVAIVATLLIAAAAHERTRPFAAFASLLVIFVLLNSPALRDKLTFNDFSGQVRRSQWTETVSLLADHAVLGVGLNGYPSAMVPYHMAEQYEIFQYPHTIVLNVWTELGLLGLVAFALIAYRVLRSCEPVSLRTSPAFLALIAMTIHGLADVPYFKNDLAMMTWILIAVVAASHYASSSRRV